jgi:hypothetical protein
VLTFFRRIRSQNNDIRLLQDAVDPVFKGILSSRILDGNLLEDITITGGTPLTIDHKLGRELKGWIVVRQDVSTQIWDSQDTNPVPSSTLILNATAATVVTINLWVF